MKVNELKDGMQDVNIEVEIDYVTPARYPDWRIIYVKDETKDIKMIFSGDDVKKAKEGKKIKVSHGYVSVNHGELQLNATKENPIEWL